MLLYIMLYIMLAYLMLLAALCNAVCLYNAFFLSFFLLLILANALCYHALSRFYYYLLCIGLFRLNIVCLFQV